MREIKFRAWDDKEEIMTNFSFSDIKHDGLVPLYVNEHGIDGYCDLQSDGIHIMQFTGLRDKNGVEIDEGDVVQMFGDYGEKRRCEVLFGDGYWIPLVRVEYGYNAIDRYDAEYFEVIGNIYENKELLNKEGL